MMNSAKTAATVEKLAQSAAQQLLTAQARLTNAFAAGEIVSAGTMENLIEAQAAAHLTAQLQKRWNGHGMRAIGDWLEDAAERLIEMNTGGYTSNVQNQMDLAERKAMQAAYKALARCRA
ncbi:hypothetical protein SEA_WENTWORTH_92 [Streptomyces phage Wentworth]|nr:hypothetical protein SEA_WENTWORTH_92 [Streptomyces phage Wentworth]